MSLTTLVDSTLLAGRYFRDIPLGGAPAVALHMAADTPVALNMSAGDAKRTTGAWCARQPLSSARLTTVTTSFSGL